MTDNTPTPTASNSLIKNFSASIGNPRCQECRALDDCRRLWKKHRKGQTDSRPTLVSGLIILATKRGFDMRCLMIKEGP
jgi:hypothetical protein